MDNGTNLRYFQTQFRSWYRTLPYRVSVMAKNDIILNFNKRHGSYVNGGTAFEKWKARKATKNKRDQGRALLIKTGRLWRSFRPDPLPGMARVVTDVPYAQRLNDGFKGNEFVKPHKRQASIKRKVRSTNIATKKTRTSTLKLTGKLHNVRGFNRRVNMPARPFMVTSPHFYRAMNEMILNDLEKMFINSFK